MSHFESPGNWGLLSTPRILLPNVVRIGTLNGAVPASSRDTSEKRLIVLNLALQINSTVPDLGLISYSKA